MSSEWRLIFSHTIPNGRLYVRVSGSLSVELSEIMQLAPLPRASTTSIVKLHISVFPNISGLVLLSSVPLGKESAAQSWDLQRVALSGSLTVQLWSHRKHSACPLPEAQLGPPSMESFLDMFAQGPLSLLL